MKVISGSAGLERTEVTGAPGITARLLGELDVRLGDKSLPPLDSARARSLLAYLLLHHDAAQPRQRVAFVLWPDSTEQQARTNLRHLLHTLRQTSPEVDGFLEVTSQTLRWRADDTYWLDVAAFESALARADAAGDRSDGAVAALREAVGYYGGDLLEGCYDAWLTEPRERLRERYISALRRLTEALADRGEHAEAIRFGRDLLRWDPLQEDTYRLLMSVHDGAGDRAGAVRVYHECFSTLERELGVEPSDATVQAYARLMRPQKLDTEAAPEPDRVAAAVLVGRDTEWKQLTDCWRKAERGHPQLVLITGEPGVGKSRLVEELAEWCAHRGAVIAQARSYPTEGELGYGVAVSWLRTIGIASRLGSAAPSHVDELARLLPELKDASQTVVPPAVDEVEQRRRLFDAVATSLTATGQPTLLVADDAQWCDAQSLQLIHYLLRLAPDNPLLVVATVRREELDEDHPVASLVGALHAIDRTTEIALGRLDRAATEQLALHLAGGVMDPADVDTLHVETEGNPLFIVETMRAGWKGSAHGGSNLPPKLQAVIGARLGRLSKEARALLGLAATVGREFTAQSLIGASGMDEMSFVRSVDELWRRGIIREQGADAYDFAHGKIREVAYDGLSPAARRRNHILIANALLSFRQPDVEAVGGEIARHYDRGGQFDNAVTWYQRAAVRAQRLHANAEAVRLLERARALVVGLPQSVSRLNRELEILSALTTPLSIVEGFASARLAQLQDRAVELAATLGIDPESSLLRSLAMSKLCRHDFDGARTAAGDLSHLAEGASDDVLLIESWYLSGIAEFWDGRFEAARRYFEEVVHGFRSERRNEHLLRFGHDPKIVCLSRLANTLWFLGRPNDAGRACHQAVAMADELRHPFTRHITYVFAALLSLELGEADRYRRYVDELLARPEDRVWRRVTTSALHGYADVLDGRVDEGLARIRAAIGTADATDQAPGQHVLMMRLLAAAYHAAGDAEGGLRAIDEALRLQGTRIWEPEMRRLRAEFLAAQGALTADVHAELERALAVAVDLNAIEPQRRIEDSRSRLQMK